MTWAIVLLDGHGYGDPMSEMTVFLRLSIVLATVAGTAGTVLAIQAWRQFRGAPFGRALALLPTFMVLFTLFHALLLVVPNAPASAEAIESAAFVLLVAFMLLMARLHFRMSRSPADESGLAEEANPTEEGP